MTAPTIPLTETVPDLSRLLDALRHPETVEGWDADELDPLVDFPTGEMSDEADARLSRPFPY